MSICDCGIRSKVFGKKMTLEVDDRHPLIKLANELPWQEMYALVCEDLRMSTLCKTWHYGRKLKVRIHLGAYLLQKLYDLTDRETEGALRDNAAYQLFCGYGIVDDWHPPDHTRIERFRSRLSPKTQQELANLMSRNAVRLGLASPEDIDIDSTVQEANMTYPTDAKMLKKLGAMALKVIKGLSQGASGLKEGAVKVTLNMRDIAAKARRCFFLAKPSTTAKRTQVLSELLEAVSEPVRSVVDSCKTLPSSLIETLSWPVKRALSQLMTHGPSYLQSVKRFIHTGSAEMGKRLSFHLDEVSCFSKKKEHKKYEFGRAFQLIRLSGNFLFVGTCTNVRLDDKKSLLPLIDEYEDYFGQQPLSSLTTDKGYYSKTNIKTLMKRHVNKVGIQVPANAKNSPLTLSDQEAETLSNRRAGIEPLIGHTKQGGQLGRSRMKNDRTIEASGYAAVLGFNLRQTIRALIKPKPRTMLL
ncbi:transposase [Methylophaga thalassica]|uniref:transposase n=1 Tax=Methylophaga aminisulfidivorans TaxID=230105 RepID=UPI0024E21706|nr:transposase [Methylophaga aminisulfidivorans]